MNAGEVDVCGFKPLRREGQIFLIEVEADDPPGRTVRAHGLRQCKAVPAAPGGEIDGDLARLGVEQPEHFVEQHGDVADFVHGTMVRTRYHERMSRNNRRNRRGKRGLHRPTEHRPPPGATPGTLAIDSDAPKPAIHLISYGEDDVVEIDIKDISEIRKRLGERRVTWINVDGLGDAETIRAVAAIFDLHPLALADVVNVHQRPKVEPYAGHLFCVTRMVQPQTGARSEQVGIFIGPNYILSFQERAGDVFDPIRDRIRHKRGRVRSMGPDYLAYLLLDAVIDGYFPVLDVYSDHIESLEEEVLAKSDRETANRIHNVKRDLLTLRRAIWPQREAMSTLLREESHLISAETRLYLRDCYDHAVQIMDMVETYRELTSGLMDVYLSSVSHRMNEIMKVLTIIATIFIPLTFIVGIYGMNFNPEVSRWNMPELNAPWGYPAVMLFMLGIALGMLGYFRHKGWLGGPRSRSAASRAEDENASRHP